MLDRPVLLQILVHQKALDHPRIHHTVASDCCGGLVLVPILYLVPLVLGGLVGHSERFEVDRLDRSFLLRRDCGRGDQSLHQLLRLALVGDAVDWT